MHDMFWSPTQGDLVQLKPAAAALWPFHVERDKPFLVQQFNPMLCAAWITPEDKKRCWHSAPTQVSELIPVNAGAAQAKQSGAA